MAIYRKLGHRQRPLKRKHRFYNRIFSTWKFQEQYTQEFRTSYTLFYWLGRTTRSFQGCTRLYWTFSYFQEYKYFPTWHRDGICFCGGDFRAHSAVGRWCLQCLFQWFARFLARRASNRVRSSSQRPKNRNFHLRKLRGVFECWGGWFFGSWWFLWRGCTSGWELEVLFRWFWRCRWRHLRIWDRCSSWRRCPVLGLPSWVSARAWTCGWTSQGCKIVLKAQTSKIRLYLPFLELFLVVARENAPVRRSLQSESKAEVVLFVFQARDLLDEGVRQILIKKRGGLVWINWGLEYLFRVHFQQHLLPLGVGSPHKNLALTDLHGVLRLDGEVFGDLPEPVLQLEALVKQGVEVNEFLGVSFYVVLVHMIW